MAVFEIGPSLREARTRRGLTPEDVQKAIRIRDRYLNALEEENWDLLPGDAYTKGFLRTYAEYLGLNGNLYVDEFNSRYARRDEEPFMPEAMVPAATPSVGLLRPLIAIAAIVLIVGAVAAWQLHGSGGSPTAATRQRSKPTTTHAAKPVAPQVPEQAVLSATRGPVWLQVRARSATGTVLFEGVLQQGKTLPLKLLGPPVWVRVGAPWNLDVRIAGRLVTGLPTSVGDVLLSAGGLAPTS